MLQEDKRCVLEVIGNFESIEAFKKKVWSPNSVLNPEKITPMPNHFQENVVDIFEGTEYDARKVYSGSKEEWCLEFWGSTEPCMGASITEESEDSVTYAFRSLGTIPIPLIQTASSIFCDLYFDLIFEHEKIMIVSRRRVFCCGKETEAD